MGDGDNNNWMSGGKETLINIPHSLSYLIPHSGFGEEKYIGKNEEETINTF